MTTPDWTQVPLDALVAHVRSEQRAQQRSVAGLRLELARAREAAGPVVVPAQTLSSWLSCVEAAARVHAETWACLSPELGAGLGDRAHPAEPPPFTLAEVVGRLRRERDILLGLLDFAERLCAEYMLPATATETQRDLYRQMAAWDARERAHLRLESDHLVPRALSLRGSRGRRPLAATVTVRQREILSHGGQRRRSTVFCPSENQSVDLAWCRGCPLAESVDANAVRCSPDPAAKEAPPTTRIGSETPVGAVMNARHVSALPEVPAAQLANATGGAPDVAVLVVDDGDHPLGIIEPAVLAASPGAMPAATIGHSIPSIREDSSVSDAIECMVRGHRRFLPVVQEDGRVAGVLSDLDILRWVARMARSSPLAMFCARSAPAAR
jgi:CBS domain-containing protein